MYQNLRTTYGGNFSFMVQISGVISDSNANETNDNSDIWSRYVDQESDNVCSTKYFLGFYIIKCCIFTRLFYDIICFSLEC